MIIIHKISYKKSPTAGDHKSDWHIIKEKKRYEKKRKEKKEKK